MSKKTAYPAFRLLDTWINYDWSNGLQIEPLEDFTEIQVETRNSVYEITVIGGRQREIVVRGGRFFPKKTPAHLAGSSIGGGGFLKVGGIYAGFSMEIVAHGKTIITTAVQTIHLYSSPIRAIPA